MLIHFVTAHGSYEIDDYNINQTLHEICWDNKIPPHSVTFYGECNEENTIIIGQFEPINTFKNLFCRIIIRPDRNIDYYSICNKKIEQRCTKDAVAEYSFSSNRSNHSNHFQLSISHCKEYVLNKVTEFIENDSNITPSSRIVIGVSGGGDSNALIEALLGTKKITPDQLLAVMMLGIPDWDKGKLRAESICKEHNVELKFVDSKEINHLLGRQNDGDWVEDFEKVFPDADLEVLGTLAVRLALVSTAKSIGAQSIVTGHNLEDILAECFLTTMQGQLPSSFPVRIIDGIPLWYPLYKIPKKILDGCNPKYSLANYIDRYPSKMHGRALIYYLAQMMNTLSPGVEFDLISGFKMLAKQNSTSEHFDEELGFSTVQKLPKELKNRWMMFTQM